MSAQHTPGPWYCEPGNFNCFSIFDHRDGRVLARLFDKRGSFPQSSFEGTQYQYDGQSEANALLMAAAPDLLAALIAVAPSPYMGEASHHAEFYRAARAAIAKATAQ